MAAHFLKPGAFLVQGIATYPNARAVRKLGELRGTQFDTVLIGVRDWLGV